MAYKQISPQDVVEGGTGAQTLTDHGILVGSGTGAVTALAVGTNGQVPIGSTGADPVFATIASSDSLLTLTGGAGSLDVTANRAVSSTSTITDHVVVRGDGGTRGVQSSGVTIDDSNNVTGVASIVINSGSILNNFSYGTFTPTIYVGGSNTGVTYSAQSGVYQIIGKRCFINASLATTSLGGLTGNITVRDFPATVSSTSGCPIFCQINTTSITLSAGYTTLAITPANGTTYGQLQQSGSNKNVSTLTHTEFTNTGSINFSGYFQIA